MIQEPESPFKLSEHENGADMASHLLCATWLYDFSTRSRWAAAVHWPPTRTVGRRSASDSEAGGARAARPPSPGGSLALAMSGIMMTPLAGRARARRDHPDPADDWAPPRPHVTLAGRRRRAHCQPASEALAP